MPFFYMETIELRYDISARIDMPDFTRNPEVVQPEPNPAREIPPGPDPDVQPGRKQDTGKLAA